MILWQVWWRIKRMGIWKAWDMWRGHIMVTYRSIGIVIQVPKTQNSSWRHKLLIEEKHLIQDASISGTRFKRRTKSRFCSVSKWCWLSTRKWIPSPEANHLAFLMDREREITLFLTWVLWLKGTIKKRHYESSTCLK